MLVVDRSEADTPAVLASPSPLALRASVTSTEASNGAQHVHYPVRMRGHGPLVSTARWRPARWCPRPAGVRPAGVHGPLASGPLVSPARWRPARWCPRPAGVRRAGVLGPLASGALV